MRSNNEIKILFYSKVLLPKIGGYVSSGVNLMKALTKIGDVILVLNDPTLTNIDLEKNSDFFQVNKIYNLADKGISVSKVFQEHNPQVVVFNGTNELDYLHNEFVNQAVQFITYEHQVPQGDSYTQEFKDRILKSHKVLVPSESLEKEISMQFDVNCDVLNLPIDTETFKKSQIPKSSFVIPKEHFVLLTVCMIKPVRNIERLLSIFQRVLNIMPNVTLLIVGDTPHYIPSSYLNELKQVSIDRGISSNICFFGAISDPIELARLYSRADIYIDTSNAETFGQAKAEALSCECVMVTTNTGNNRSLVPLDFQVILSDEDEGLVKSIVSLLQSPNLEEIGQKCREYVINNFSVDVISKKLKEIIIGGL